MLWARLYDNEKFTNQNKNILSINIPGTKRDESIWFWSIAIPGTIIDGSVRERKSGGGPFLSPAFVLAAKAAACCAAL